jgi:hypothetical protein
MNTVGTESIIASAIALRRVPGSLLVTRLNVNQVRVVERVIGRQVGPTGDAEDVFDALGLQRFTQSVGSTHWNEIVGGSR